MSKKICEVYYRNQRLNVLVLKCKRLVREQKTVEMIVLKAWRFRFYELFKNIKIR